MQRGALITTRKEEPNSQMIEWRGSDGSSARRPTGVSFVDNRDRAGNVNFYRPIRDTEEVSVAWRRDIGTYIAEALGLPRKYLFLRAHA
jgi:hypothetical protein